MLKSKNLSSFNRKITFLSSPLSLLVLSACGGGGSVQTGPGGTTATTVTGNAVKGPLSNAWVFLDYNDNGVWDDGIDSARVRTDSQGAFALTATNDTYTIVATTDQMTTDTSTGAVFSGVKMSAPSGAQVVTPATTLMEEAGISVEQIAEVLGLPDGVDPLSFNPYASGVNAGDALAVEKASQQIMSVVNAFAGAAEGAGASEADAFEAALNSVVEVVKVKATNLTDANASAADKTLDLTSDADLALVKAEVVSKVAAETSADTTAFNDLADDTTSAVKNVNAKIATVTDLSSDAAKNTFSTTQVLADQTKQAAEAEVQSAGSGSIDFTDATKVNTAAANKAPSDIALSKTAIAEDASSLVIGTLTTTDSDQTSGVLHTYKIAELSGTDYAAFSINAATGELSFKAQPDFETKSSYSITILSTDEGGKTYSKSFTISVTDVNEAPTLTVPTGGAVTEDASTSTITGSLSNSDPEDDAPTYSVVGETAPDGSYTVTGTYGTLTLNASTGAYSYALNNSASAVQALKASDSKTESFSVQVTDGTNTPAAQTLSFTIQGANDAPTVANAISDQTIAEDSTLNFQFASDVFSDVDAGDSLTYTATLSNGSARPSWLGFDAATRTFSGTPANSDVGALDVTVTATDGSTATASDTFTLSVTPITSISISTTDFIAEEGSSTGAFTLTRTGSLTNSLTVDLQFSGTAQNGSDYDTISQTAVFSAGQESLTLTVNPKKDTNTEGAETVNAEILSSSDYAIENPSASLEIRDTGYIAAGKVAPLAETFQLNSLPGADITFYLNFLGGNASANTTVQPFTIDGDPTTYTAEEHITIQRLWTDVAEDFAPFNVNVTTQKPSDDALKRLTTEDSQYGIEMIIGDTNGNAFAVAGYQISGIGENSYLPGFVKWGSGYGPTANAISHEFGHMLGLDHDGSNIDGNYLEYYGGHQTGSGTWMPIMGVSGWGMGQWSNGDYVGATETEDDLAIITRAENGIEYRIDDHADVKDFATNLVVLNDGRGTLFAEGIIEKNTDEDWFEFVHSGGNLTISIDTIDKDPHTAFSPNLDISAELYNASGSLIQENGLNSRWLDATISQQNLAAGTYYLKVDGVGNPDAQSPSSQGYSDYGSMGAYTVKSGYGTVALFNTDQSSSSSRLDLANFNSTTEFSNDVSTTISQNGLGVFVGESNEYMRVQALNGVEDTNEYLSFTITPGSGKAVDLSDLTASFYINFDATLIITSDQDNFSSKLSTSVLPELQRLVIDLDGLPTITSETELRMQIVSDTPDDDPFRFFDIYGEGKPSSLGPSIGLELNGYVLDAAQGQVATGYEDEFVPDIA